MLGENPWQGLELYRSVYEEVLALILVEFIIKDTENLVQNGLVVRKGDTGIEIAR